MPHDALHNGWVYDSENDDADAQPEETPDDGSLKVQRTLVRIRRAQNEVQSLAQELFGGLRGDELKEAVEDVLHGDVQNCREVAACVAERDGRALRPFMANFADDEEIAVTAASSHPDGFFFLNDAMRGNEKVIDAAVNYFPPNIRFASPEFLKNTPAVMRLMMKLLTDNEDVGRSVLRFLTIGVGKHPRSGSPSPERRCRARVEHSGS